MIALLRLARMHPLRLEMHLLAAE